MLKLENVSKKLNRFYLKDISMELPSGYILGLIGENGAGKTTLMNLISGLYMKDGGRIALDEMEYYGDEGAIKQEIGTVFHGELFEGQESLIKNANRYGRFYQRYEEGLFRNYAERFQLDIQRKYRKLSKGEKQKASMAFALAHNPRLLLLDEPTANFDKEFRKEFFEILREFTQNGENSVILSTHMTSDIDRIADYLLFLKNGKQLLFGDIESIRWNYRMAAGETYKLKLLKERVIHMEVGEFGSKALVLNSKKPFDPQLKVWEPSTEELMYHMAKGAAK